MDAMTQLADRIRSTGSLLGTSLLSPPWSIRMDESATLTVLTMLRGEAWLCADDSPARRLGPRDLAIVTGPRPFSVASGPDPALHARPQYTYTATGVCIDESGAELPDELIGLDVRTCGVRLDAEHALLTGSSAADSRLTRRLIGGLPRVLVVLPDRQRRTPIDLLEDELCRDEPGQQAVLDRLLDLVLIGALRDWLAQSDGVAPAWYSAAADEVVGPALDAIHAQPGHPHTVASLAGCANASRSVFARRFSDLLGESPIAYLTGWRLCIAADMLRESDDTVEVIARQVGYSSAFALSNAFHRAYGERPSRYRQRTLGRMSTANGT